MEEISAPARYGAAPLPFRLWSARFAPAGSRLARSGVVRFVPARSVSQVRACQVRACLQIRAWFAPQVRVLRSRACQVRVQSASLRASRGLGALSPGTARVRVNRSGASRKPSGSSRRCPLPLPRSAACRQVSPQLFRGPRLPGSRQGTPAQEDPRSARSAFAWGFPARYPTHHWRTPANVGLSSSKITASVYRRFLIRFLILYP